KMPDTPNLDDHCTSSPSPPNWGTAMFNPGSYCGKLALGGSLVATFNAGTYVFWGGLDLGGDVDLTFEDNTQIITVGGGLRIGNSAKVKGTGVSFYNTCRKQAGDDASTCPITGQIPATCPTAKQGKKTINLCGSFQPFSFSGGNRTISLTAPASGAFRNILLYSDVPGYVNVIEGSAKLNGAGIICLPSQDLSVSGGPEAGLVLDGAVTANRISAVGSAQLTVSRSNSVADVNGQPCLLSTQMDEDEDRVYLQ
ncbi:cupredoxin domain-containing protein, partial [Methyloparacoccus murrellii]